MAVVGLALEDVVIVYSAVLSTVLAAGSGVRSYRRWSAGRKIIVKFSYGYAYDELSGDRLIVRVRNGSPTASFHLLQIGWKSTHEAKPEGDWWDVDGQSIRIEAGATYVREFPLQSRPAQVVGTVVLGDHRMRDDDGPSFSVPYIGDTRLGDSMQLRTDS